MRHPRGWHDLEKPRADGFLDGCEFPIGLVKLGLGRLRPELGRYRLFFRDHDARLGLLQGS